MEDLVLLGRREILTDASVIDENNILQELSDALSVHNVNRSEIQYLWNYYRGEQDILQKEKVVRPEINNKIVVNRANEIVSFKVGYLVGEPITYVAKPNDDAVRQEVMKLNEAMHVIGKESQDSELIKWDMICGVAYRYISTEPSSDDVPFSMYTLDPRTSFVVKSSDIRRKPMMGVYGYWKANPSNGVVRTSTCELTPFSDMVYKVYTDTMYYTIENGMITEKAPNYLGMIPIVEYPANEERQGCFEIVLPLLNALNAAYSDRLDNVDSVVQAFLKFVNCDIDANGLKDMRELGAIKIKSENNLPADVDLVAQEINQSQLETMIASIDNKIDTICGIPSRNGGDTSTSDTGMAVVYRNGYVSANTKAQDSENIYKMADKKTLSVIFNICASAGYCKLNVSDVDSKFTRRNYDNLQSKAQVLIAMLQNPKIHPELAFTASGMFTDPEEAYAMSMKYYTELEESVEKVETADNADNITNRTDDFLRGKDISNPVENIDALVN